MIIMLVAVALVFGAIFGFKAFVNGKIQEVFDNMQQPPAAITVDTAETVSWQSQVEAVGSVAAVSGADLSTAIGGIVAEVGFENGQRVEQGQLLMALDTDADEAELASLEAALTLAEQELTRQKTLFNQGSISQAQLDQAESQADQARARVNAQRERIDLKRLTAPFAGITGIRQVNPGQFVAPGTPLVSLQSLDPVYVEFSISERSLSRLNPGDLVSVTVDAWDGESFQGEINAIEPSVQVSTRTVAIQATLANPEEKLRPGMFAHVDIAVGAPQQSVVIPQTAVRYSPYGNTVFVVKRDGENLTVEQRFVTTGQRRGDLIAVIDGLEPGEDIASSGLLKLQNGSRVEINDDPQLQPSTNPAPEPEQS
jgi:membrane fusion protein (multidrug efflux system)